MTRILTLALSRTEAAVVFVELGKQYKVWAPPAPPPQLIWGGNIPEQIRHKWCGTCNQISEEKAELGSVTKMAHRSNCIPHSLQALQIQVSKVQCIVSQRRGLTASDKENWSQGDLTPLFIRTNRSLDRPSMFSITRYRKKERKEERKENGEKRKEEMKGRETKWWRERLRMQRFRRPLYAMDPVEDYRPILRIFLNA